MNQEQKLILVIEDDVDIRNSLKVILEGEGYAVLTAENGFDAMEILKTSKIPNLILLDMKMPVMNGWEFAIEFLSKHDHLSPIVVMTAAANAEKRAGEISAIGWLSKPFELDEMLKMVKKYER